MVIAWSVLLTASCVLASDFSLSVLIFQEKQSKGFSLKLAFLVFSDFAINLSTWHGILPVELINSLLEIFELEYFFFRFFLLLISVNCFLPSSNLCQNVFWKIKSCACVLVTFTDTSRLSLNDFPSSKLLIVKSFNVLIPLLACPFGVSVYSAQ